MSSIARYEVKFSVSQHVFTRVMAWIYSETLCKKSFPDRQVNSIYFDDMHRSSMQDNLIGVADRVKTRLRWYKGANGVITEPVWELKRRNGRLGSKEIFPLDGISNILHSSSLYELTKAVDAQLPKNHDSLLKHKVPVLRVVYARKYFEDPLGLRITVDDQIAFGGNLSLTESAMKRPQIAYPSKVIELKFSQADKNRVSQIIKNLQLTPTRHSKYLAGLAMTGSAVYV